MSTHGKIAKKFEGPFGETIKRYKDGFYLGIKCDWYDPCPICRRCQVKNKKYERCKNCKVKSDYHSTKEKNLMSRSE